MFAQRMPATGYVASRSGPGSFVIAIGINAALIGALFYAGRVIEFTPKKPPIETWDVKLDPPPPKVEPPKEKVADARPAPPDRIDTTDLAITTPLEKTVTYPDAPPVPFNGGTTSGEGTGSGTGVTIDPPKPPAPVIVQPGIDMRYMAEFQPAYPPEERRAGRDGRVVVRALVGVDGRVKQLERVSATTDAFWRATLDRALKRWRFTPGTRDGIPVESWRVMTLSFRMED